MNRGRGWFLIASSVVWLVAMGCSSSDDGAGGTAGSGGAAASGGAAGDGGAGGEVSDGNCEMDGYCRDGERCTCRECWPMDECAFDACVDDGECANDEGCTCNDCQGAPECEDYCVPCSEFIRQLVPPSSTYPPKGALCQPESVTLYEAFEQCACMDSCADECADTLCAGTPPSGACLTCYVTNCDAERRACGRAVRPDIFCNPVTGQPCLEGEQCDRVQPFPGTVSGFFCWPPPSAAGICEACNTNQNMICGNTLTCVDDEGDLPSGNGSCGRYCCTDEDCDAGTCFKGTYAPAAPDLGVCTEDGGGIPGCEVSEPSPSGGTCVAP